jgi:uncharacterized membrane protein
MSPPCSPVRASNGACVTTPERTPVSVLQTQRLEVLDAQRGLIMALMAIDHAALFLASQHYSEFWGTPLPAYPHAFGLFTRVISHLCAPGFFFLMGVGMHFFWASRSDRGWTQGKITRHFAIRGSVLILVDIFIILPAMIFGMWEQIFSKDATPPVMPGVPGDLLLAINVLATLGMAMIVSAFAMRLPGKVIAALGVALLVACQALLPEASEAFNSEPHLWRLLLVAGQEGFLVVNYPLLPWLAVCLLGIAYGTALRANPSAALKAALPGGIAMLVLFAIVRGVGGFGAHHPMSADTWMAMLEITKYPPSIAFVLFSLGANALFLTLILRTQQHLTGIARPLLVFGRSALFFYVLHMILYAVMGRLYPGETSLLGMYPFWLLGLVMLYPACKWWDGFKRGTADESIWRLF